MELLLSDHMMGNLFFFSERFYTLSMILDLFSRSSSFYVFILFCNTSWKETWRCNYFSHAQLLLYIFSFFVGKYIPPFSLCFPLRLIISSSHFSLNFVKKCCLCFELESSCRIVWNKHFSIWNKHLKAIRIMKLSLAMQNFIVNTNIPVKICRK